MENQKQYIDKNRKKLLRYLDPTIPRGKLKPNPLCFANQVIDDWYGKFAHKPLPEATLAERTFWFAIYQLEELEELRMLEANDPMIEFMEANLARMRQVLKVRGDIPTGYWATRPYEPWPEDEYDDNYDEQLD